MEKIKVRVTARVNTTPVLLSALITEGINEAKPIAVVRVVKRMALPINLTVFLISSPWLINL